MADALRGSLIDNLGRPIVSAVVRVYVAGGALASIYSDKTLTTPITNDGATSPLTEADGSYGPYYAASGRYDIKYLLAGYTFDDTDTADIVLDDIMGEVMTITKAHVFTGAVVHQGAETHSAAEVHTGAETHSGIETHSNAETHSGAEVHNGAESFVGQPGFNPAAPAAPFTLNANAQNQLVTGLRAASADAFSDGVNVIHMKIVEIGAWNMDTTASVSVAHGIADSTKIRPPLSVLIKHDSYSNLFYDLNIEDDAGTGTQGALAQNDGVNITLNRKTGGIFDKSWFSAGGNRGWITITYID